MKYNLKLSKPQAQQLKDVMQKTSFSKIDSSWRIFARVVNVEKSTQIPLYVGDTIYTNTDWSRPPRIFFDPAQKILILDKAYRVRCLHSTTHNETISFNQAKLENPNICLNAEPYIQTNPGFLGSVLSLNGDMHFIPNTFQFSELPDGYDGVLCEVKLFANWFYTNELKSCAMYTFTRDEVEGEDPFFFKCAAYKGIVNGVMRNLVTGTLTDGKFYPSVADGDLFIVDINTGELTLVDPDDVIENFGGVLQTPGNNDVFDEYLNFCGNTEWEYGSKYNKFSFSGFDTENARYSVVRQYGNYTILKEASKKYGHVSSGGGGGGVSVYVENGWLYLENTQ